MKYGLMFVVLLAAGGCKTTTYAPWMDQPGEFHFKNVPLAAQGEILPMVTAESNGTYFDPLGVVSLFVMLFGGEPVTKIPFKSASIPKAIQDALESSNGGHILAAPLIEESYSQIPFFPLIFTKRVTVTGVPVQLKNK